MKKHILVISQYFYPEQFRINDICEEWIKSGYRVTVITGIPNYPQGKYFHGYNLLKKRKERYKGIDIIRIPIIARGKNKAKLALNYISFVISGYFWKSFTRLNADYVFIFEVSPMTQALPGVWYAKKKKIPCYIYVQDLWPENVEIITGVKNKNIIGVIGKIVDYIYKNCTKIFTTSESFIHAIHGRGVPREKIEFWPQYAEDFYYPFPRDKVQEISNNKFFNVIFTGNIGAAQGLDILPKVAEILREKKQTDIIFHIVGDGRYKKELIQTINSKGLENMFHFIPKKPAEKIPEFLAACDAAFLSLSDNPLFEMTIPAKLQSYMACGIPILAAASGETSRIINEARAGICVKPGAKEELAKIIIEFAKQSKEERNICGINARNYYENHFDKKRLLDKMDKYFV